MVSAVRAGAVPLQLHVTFMVRNPGSVAVIETVGRSSDVPGQLFDAPRTPGTDCPLTPPPSSPLGHSTVDVAVGVGVPVAVEVGVGVFVEVAVGVGVGVDVGVCVGVADGTVTTSWSSDACLEFDAVMRTTIASRVLCTPRL